MDIYELIEERQEELFAILRDMVKIDSQNFHDGTGLEAEMAYHLEKVYKEMGLAPDVFSPLSVGIEDTPDYYPGRHLENRYNCAAVVPGSEHAHRILLAGHEDTVIIGDRSQWKHDPFGGEIIDGKMYGRGVGDDKFGIAIPIYIMKLFQEQGIVLPYDVVLAGYSDEENGGSNGALALNMKYPCDEALNLDGGSMRLECSGAGGGVVKVTLLCDDPCDSCAVISEAFDIFRGEMALWGRERGEEFRAVKEFRDTPIPDTTVRYQDVHAGFGGTAMDKLETSITFYTIHDEKTTRKQWEEVEKRFHKRASSLHVRITGWELTTRFFHYVQGDPGSKASRLLQKAYREICGIESKPSGMCLSDFPMFTIYGTPTALTTGCGRPFEVEGGAHQIDEYVETSDLVNFAKAIAYFLLNYRF